MAKTQTKTTWKQFDAADYIKSEKDITLYLDAVMDEAADNPALLAHALGDVARARRNMSQLAREAGVTREGLYKALSPVGNPSFATVARIARALGLEIHFRALKKPTKDREHVYVR
jgi:probable addiction module antidote protein